MFTLPDHQGAENSFRALRVEAAGETPPGNPETEEAPSGTRYTTTPETGAHGENRGTKECRFETKEAVHC